MADAAVLSSDGRARMAAVSNVGAVVRRCCFRGRGGHGQGARPPAAIAQPRPNRCPSPFLPQAALVREHQTAPELQDLSQLPLVEKPGPPKNVLGRTESGALVSTPSSATSPRAAADPLHRAGGSGGAPFKTKPPSPGGSGKPVAVTAVAGAPAGGAAVAAEKKRAQAEAAADLQRKLNELEKKVAGA